MRVVVVATGTANTASVVAALRRLGVVPELSDQPDAVSAATHVVLPGVGAFAAARATLDERGLVPALVERVEADRPLLGICLGLQLLAEGSEESPGVEGLGLIPGTARHFPEGVSVPQLGWNRVTAGEGCRLLQDGYASYANSYRLTEAPPGWQVATTDHGGPFLAAIERGNILACQFHPEISGAWGQSLLARWLEGSC